MAARILLVEDEMALLETLRLNLELEGYHITVATDGRQALKAFKEARFDLILLDLMLPGIDGLTVCQSIRLENAHVPILMLTARSTTQDKIEGLKTGADDYLTKPFNLEELLLRISNLIRRTQRNELGLLKSYVINNRQVDFASQEIITPDNQKIKLTRKETLLLRLLVEKRNQVVSREQILQTVWGYDIYPSTRTIDNFIVNFRKYFENDPSQPQFFISVRGVGYKFTD
jgi:two-component system alkaline phosphatase synthesis response regulator PhoP